MKNLRATVKFEKLAPIFILSALIFLFLTLTGCAQETVTPLPTQPANVETIIAVSPGSPVSPLSSPRSPSPSSRSTLSAQLTEPLSGQITQGNLKADFVRLPLYELFFWTGMTWDNAGHIWIVNNQIKLIAGLNVVTLLGDRNLEFPVSDNQTKEPYFTGLAWDGSSLWAADVENRIIYQIDANNGEKLTEFTYDGSPTGMVWFDDGLWVISMEKRIIEKLSATGERLSSIELQGTWPSGLTWDGKYFWYSDGQDGSVYILNPDNTKIRNVDEIRFLTNPNTFNGLVRIDGYLWIVTELEDHIHRFDISQLNWETIENELK